MNKEKIKVLIVEDENPVAESIRIQLEQLSYEVVGIVDNSEEAIQLVAKLHPDFVLMDIILKGDMDGIQTAEAIRSQFKIPVIYLTAHTNQDFLDRAKLTEPLAYIVKPCSERDLYAALTVASYKAESERQKHDKNMLDATLVSLSDALIAWNLDGKIIRVNRALLSLLGTTEQALLGSDILHSLKFTHADTANPMTESLIYYTEKSGLLKDVYSLILHCADMRQVPVRVSGNRIFDEHYQTLGYVLLIRDDTERKQQEQVIRDSEERFRQLVDHLESVFCLSDTQSDKVIYLSRAFEQIFAVKTQDVSTKSSLFLNHVYPDDHEKVQSLLSSSCDQNGGELTFRINRSDGDMRWVHARCYPVKNPATDNAYRTACIIEDVTERKGAESRLTQNAKIFENTNEGILITDADQKIVSVNNAFTNITGYTLDDVHGMTPRILNSGYHNTDFYEQMWQTIIRDGCWQGENHNRRKNGDIYPQWMTISTIHDDDGNIVNYFAIFSDISVIKKSQDELNYLAHHDHLTGFANRLLFNARLDHALKQADREKEKIAVLLMDLDRFKNINDSFGHEVGDMLLKKVAERLSACLREEDTRARLGGDEFIFILEGIKETKNLLWIAQKIQTIFAEPFLLANREIMMTCSMGISIYPDDAQNVETLVKHADMAMYKAKQQGKNRYEFYTEELNIDSTYYLTMATQMRLGLQRNEFVLHYQPVVSLLDKTIIGFEALIRWQHPEQGLLLPLQFIPLAEETGFIETLGAWVLYEACRQCKSWQEEGVGFFSVAVNLSPWQFTYGDIIKTVKNVLDKSGLDGRYLDLEITESCLMHDMQQVLTKLDGLKAMGISLSIDDFGTGYSSLSYLKRFPINKLKIDKSFVKDLPADIQDMAISRAIIALGSSLELIVVAEGVETQGQWDLLLAQGCDQMQGYLFSKPLPADQIKYFNLPKICKKTAIAN